MGTYLFIWTALGAINAYFAKKRGRDPYIWFAIGSLTGLLGLIGLYLLPSKVRKQDANEIIVKVEPIPSYERVEWFYLDENHQQVGPRSYREIKIAFHQKKISLDSFVWHEELADWQKLNELHIKDFQ